MLSPSLTKNKARLCAICITVALFLLLIADYFCNFPLKAMQTMSREKGVFVPIIMYHSVNKNDALAGDYVLPPIELEKDIVYLKQQGYTPVFISDIIDFVYIGTPLPEKPVALTFDDGFKDNLENVLPLMEKYDFKCTVSIVGAFAQRASDKGFTSYGFPYLNFDEISTLYDSCHVEIANHTYNMHSFDTRNGCGIKQGESYEDYRNALIYDLDKNQTLLKDNCKIVPQVFTYPYGVVSEPSLRIVKACGFKASLGVEEKPNYITKDPDCLYNLNRYNRPYGISSEKFFDKALKG